jgi:hypothetical protein
MKRMRGAPPLMADSAAPGKTLQNGGEIF